MRASSVLMSSEGQGGFGRGESVIHGRGPFRAPVGGARRSGAHARAATGPPRSPSARRARVHPVRARRRGARRHRRAQRASASSSSSGAASATAIVGGDAAPAPGSCADQPAAWIVWRELDARWGVVANDHVVGDPTAAGVNAWVTLRRDRVPRKPEVRAASARLRACRAFRSLSILSTFAACASTPPAAAPCPVIPAPAAPVAVAPPASAPAPTPARAPLPEVSGYDKPPQNVPRRAARAVAAAAATSARRATRSCSCRGWSTRRWRASPSRSSGSPACASSRGRGASTTRRAATASRRARASFALVDVADGARDAGRAARRRLRRRRRRGRPTASASRSATRRRTRSSCGSATPRPARCTRLGGVAPEPDARQHAAVDARSEDAPREARARRRGRAAAGAGRRRSGRASRRPTARRARAARTRRATRSTNKHDEDLFDYYATRAARARRRGDRRGHAASASPAIYTDVDAAPDGEHILVDVDPQAVLVRHDVRPLPARRRGVGPQPASVTHASRRCRSPIACPIARRADGPARLRVARRPSRRRSCGPRRSTAATGT